MHELSLFGQVPASRRSQLLKILAGVTAMQPHTIAELHQIYKPTIQPQQAVHVGGSQSLQQRPGSQNVLNRELVYMQLVHALHDESVQASSWRDALKAEGATAAWSLQSFDQPDAAKRPVTMRSTHIVGVAEGKPQSYMVSLGYEYLRGYVLEGHRFVYNNVVILLHRILKLSTQTGKDPSSLEEVARDYAALSPIDESDSYILTASIKLGSGHKPDLVTKAMHELDEFRRRMKGVVNLRAADRLAMDTRVR